MVGRDRSRAPGDAYGLPWHESSGVAVDDILSVRIPPVFNLQHGYRLRGVVDLVENSVLADSYTPVATATDQLLDTSRSLTGRAPACLGMSARGHSPLLAVLIG
jgi:hypothetical protein